MSRKVCNLVGNRYGRLIVIEVAGKDYKGGVMWKCVCDCGSFTVVPSWDLKNNHTKSCGCLHKSVVGISNTLPNGKSRTLEYRSWIQMIGRCYNINNKKYKNYGGRGITVCDEWRDVNTFMFDMGSCPEGYSIERIDVNGNYCKENCKWIPLSEQALNRTNTIRVNGRTLRELSILNGTSYSYEYKKYSIGRTDLGQHGRDNSQIS